MKHKHEPTQTVNRFEDAWLGSIKIGNYESGYEYKPIVCKHCGTKIKASRDLTEWNVYEA